MKEYFKKAAENKKGSLADSVKETGEKINKEEREEEERIKVAKRKGAVNARRVGENIRAREMEEKARSEKEEKEMEVIEMLTMEQVREQISTTPNLFISEIEPSKIGSPMTSTTKKAVEQGATHRLMYDSGNWRIGDIFQGFVKS